ncbi:MAG: lipoate--protein ligase [bacterium]|nr:lipoate--protein ligase [bacterium]
MANVLVIKSSKTDVYENLAFETCLLDYATKNKDVAILFLWTNDKTVVIGKHQNPYKECNLNYMEQNQIKVSRRITGGGAVYHDKNNINFSFVMSNDLYDVKRQFEVILKALKKIGFSATLSGRNDMEIDGKKFSGNAFYKTKTSGLHHGTILVDTDVDLIKNCLTPNKMKIKKHSVSSVKSRVVNLKEIKSDISKDEIINSITEEFEKEYGVQTLLEDTVIDKSKVEEITQKYGSKEWLFAKYKEEGIRVSGNFDWGFFELVYVLDNGKVVFFEPSTDSLETEIFDMLKEYIIGKTLNDLENCTFAKTKLQKDILSDILLLVLNK